MTGRLPGRRLLGAITLTLLGGSLWVGSRGSPAAHWPLETLRSSGPFARNQVIEVPTRDFKLGNGRGNWDGARVVGYRDRIEDVEPDPGLLEARVRTFQYRFACDTGKATFYHTVKVWLDSDPSRIWKANLVYRIQSTRLDLQWTLNHGTWVYTGQAVPFDELLARMGPPSDAHYQPGWNPRVWLRYDQFDNLRIRFTPDKTVSWTPLAGPQAVCAALQGRLLRLDTVERVVPEEQTIPGTQGLPWYVHSERTYDSWEVSSHD